METAGKPADAPWSTDRSAAIEGRAFARVAARRGNFYYTLGILVLLGIAAAIALGALGVSSLGVFTVRTAMTVIGTSIAVLAVAQFVSLTSLRTTMRLLSEHESAFMAQDDRHVREIQHMERQMRELSRIESKWHAEQTARDGQQDRLLDDLTTTEYAHHAEIEKKIETAATRRAKPGSRQFMFNPFDTGQVHPVKDVEGIGEHYGELLKRIGISNTAQLWGANSAFVAGRIGVAPKMVENWQCMAELMAVTGIGKQYAELLVRAGVVTIRRLANEDPEALAHRIQRLESRRDHRVQGNAIGAKLAEHWIEAASTQLGMKLLMQPIG